MGLSTPTLYTPRLVLRRFAPADLPHLHRLLADPAVNTFLPWLPHRTMAETEAFCRERFLPDYRAGQGHHWAVCLRADHCPIGYINVSGREPYDFGYALAREHWGQGIATEAGLAALALLRREGPPYITATHDRENPRSGGVMRRLGMRYCYTYPEQWQPKDLPVQFRLYQLDLDGHTHGVYDGYRRRYPGSYVEPGL